MSKKLSAMFDQNPAHTFDKIVENILQQKMLPKFDLEPKSQGHSQNKKTTILGTNNMPPPKKLEQGGPLKIDVTLTAVKQYVDPPPPLLGIYVCL